MISTEELYRAVRSIIKKYIGDSLSTPNAIIKARQAGVRPKYPYATMDILNISDTNSHITNKSMNANGSDVYETHQDVVFSIGVRSASENGQNLIETVKRAFNFNTVLDTLYNDVEATVATTSPVMPYTEVLSNRMQAFYQFTVTLRVNSVITDEDSFPIEHFTVENIIFTANGEQVED